MGVLDINPNNINIGLYDILNIKDLNYHKEAFFQRFDPVKVLTDDDLRGIMGALTNSEILLPPHNIADKIERIIFERYKKYIRVAWHKKTLIAGTNLYGEGSLYHARMYIAPVFGSRFEPGRDIFALKYDMVVENPENK